MEGEGPVDRDDPAQVLEGDETFGPVGAQPLEKGLPVGDLAEDDTEKAGGAELAEGRQLREQMAVAAFTGLGDDDVEWTVLTSYSIHYTKLYE